MPFVGDLRRIGPARLLEVLSVGRKSGLLRLRSGREGFDIQLRGGRCEQVVPVKGPGPLDELLATLPANPDDRESVKRLAGGDELGTVLLLDFLGVSSRERSLAVLRQWAIAALRGASGWQKGDFRFEPAAESLRGRLTIGLAYSLIRAELSK